MIVVYRNVKEANKFNAINMKKIYLKQISSSIFSFVSCTKPLASGCFIELQDAEQWKSSLFAMAQGRVVGS